MKCFNFYKSKCINCTKKSCKFWIDSDSTNNCALLSAKEGPKTLQEIGDIFGVTRMRICQIEKKAIGKFNKILQEDSNDY